MKSPRLAAVALAAITCGTVVAVPPLRQYADTHEQSCLASLMGVRDHVHTTRWEPAADLSDLGNYKHIHWQGDAPGNTCLHKRKRSEFSYQLVIRLTPDDAAALVARMEKARPSRPGSDSNDLNPDGYPVPWPPLQRWVPANGRWIRVTEYDAERPTSLHRTMWLDQANAVAVVQFGAD